MRKIFLILLLALMLPGCKSMEEIRPDTIVDIPLRPTVEVTEPQTEGDTVPPETVTEPPETEPPTQPPTEGGGSGGKKPSGSRPPATQPPTDPPTQPPTDPPTQPAQYDPAGYAPGRLDRAVADAVNARRREAGLPELTLDTRLSAIASVRAWEASVVLSQNRPDGSAPLSLLAEYGYACRTSADVFWYGSGGTGAGTIVDKWMSSASRREKLLMADAAVIGVGSFSSPDGFTYVAVFIAG